MNDDQEKDKTSYFRYGPFDSTGRSQDESTDEKEQDQLFEDVQITSPEPVKPIPVMSATDQDPFKGWAAPKRSRSSWKSMFASFMAGVVVVGGLMFASDKANLFTGSDQPASGNSITTNGSVQTTTSSGGNSPVYNAALDIVRPNTIADIVANSRAAVVKIETYAKSSNRSRGGSSVFDDPFFRQFFGDDFGQPNNSGDQSGTLQKIGEGSGFVFDSEGFILTNQHVIDGADQIKVYLEGYDEPFIATKLGESFDQDLAALRIKADKPLPSLPIGDVDKMRVGDWVVAIGNPYSYDHTVTVGVLSAKERPIQIPDGQSTRKYEHLLQTDASINPGNSGGPLLNLNGEVIGINTAVNAQAQGIGFAIPTSTVTGVLENLKNNKLIPREPAPYIGVVLGQLDEEAAKELGFKGTDGAIVSQVEVDGPARKAGVQAWDIITEVAGTKVKSSSDVVDIVKSKKVGDKIMIKVFREGKTYEVAITVGDRNAEKKQ